MPLSWDDAQTLEKAPATDTASTPASDTSAPLSWDDAQAAEAAKPQQEPPAQASIDGYIATRGLGGLMEGGKQLATATNLEMGYLPDAAETNALPSGQDQANRAVYGTTNVPAPNTASKFIGDLVASIGANPPSAVMAPGATVAASGLSSTAEQAGLPPWVGALAAPFLMLLAKGGASAAKIAAPAVKDTVRSIILPTRTGQINAGRTLASVDNSAALPQPSAADVSGAQDAVRAATADMTADATPASQVGEQIRTDLTGRQAALKAQREAQTAPIAAARDASTATVDTYPVVSLIGDKLRTAAGPQAEAINGALTDLKYPSGALRSQADALAQSRQAINARISAAKSAGDNATVKHLSDIRDALDTQVNAAVPEAGQFNTAYKAASEPLDVFTPGRSSVDTVSNVVARDNFGNLNGTPPSEIPDAFLRGSATKEKLDQLVQAYGGDKAAAESALEQHLAEVARTAVRDDGTFDPAKFAKAMQPYQKVLTSATPAPAQPTIAQRAAVAFQKARAASDMNMPADGDPSRSFSSIAQTASLEPGTVGPNVLKTVAPTGKPGINLETLPGRTRTLGVNMPVEAKTVVFRDANGAPRGVADFSQGEPTVYVDPAYQRQGIATQMYQLAQKNGINVNSGTGPMTPAGTALSTKWNAGNIGAWFPNLKTKFANAQAAQNTLDTLSAQRSLTQSIAGGELRDPTAGVVTAKSFSSWLKGNKAQLSQAQSPAAVLRLEQIAKALGKAGENPAEAVLSEAVPIGVGMATGGTEGGILAGMAHKLTGTIIKPYNTRYNAAFNGAIERAALDPLYARQLVSQLPRGPYSASAAARAFARVIATTPAQGATAAITTGQSLSSSRR